jgi:hydroxyacyl-ACP dehydratase HTD2-like protein with hotdog domain
MSTESLAAQLAATDWTAWIGKSERKTVFANREQVGLLESTLCRTGPEAKDALAPLRHWMWIFAPPASPTAVLSPDGHAPRGPLVPTWPLPRRMWAGSTIEWLAPLPLDVPLERVSTIESIEIKTGRSGTLGFVGLRSRWYANGVCGIDELQTAVYREAVTPTAASGVVSPVANFNPEGPSFAAPAAVSRTASGGWVASCVPSETLLFRYSAVTFNTHRIHYDHPYTTGIEGYAGLVVHGPLLGTLMLDAWRDAHPGTAPKKFDFKAMAPSICGQRIEYGGDPIAPGHDRVWVRGADGKDHVVGEVRY